jgi:hypothetical protein
MTELEQATRALHDAKCLISVEYSAVLAAIMNDTSEREFADATARYHAALGKLPLVVWEYTVALDADKERRLRDAEFIESTKKHPMSAEGQAFLALHVPKPIVES